MYRPRRAVVVSRPCLTPRLTIVLYFSHRTLSLIWIEIE